MPGWWSLRKGRTIRRALPLAAATVLIWQLFPSPAPGVADNGDFAKMLGRFSLSSGQTFVYANTRFHAAPGNFYRSGFSSSELLLLGPALAINRVISEKGSFDLRIMGGVQASLLVLAAWLIAPVLDSAVTAALALLLFCDFMYAGFFNAFYVEGTAYVFTLLAAVFYLRAMRLRGGADAAAMLACMLLAVTASAHYAILGPWFAILLWVGRRVLWGGRKATAAAAALAVVLVSWASYRFSAPEFYASFASFNVIFSQIVPHAEDPHAALQELGLDDSYRQWSGMQAYTPGAPVDDPEFHRRFVARTSYAKIGRFYLAHPRDAWKALCASLDEAGRFQSPLGNFDSGSGKPPAAHYEGFQLVSRLKKSIFYKHGGRLALSFTALALLVPALLWRARKRLPAGALAGGAVLAAMALATLVISSLGDVYDQFRHQVVTFALFDMLLMIVAALACRVRPGAAAGGDASRQPL